jgi:hypothetical protein
MNTEIRHTMPASAIASGLCTMLLAVMPLLAPAAPAASEPASRADVRFAALQIDIWPEFDRKAALVILKGELSPDVRLPATLTLRLPASAGGPSAVAYASRPDAQLYNLAHHLARGAEFITLGIQAPERYLQVEFYEPLVINAADRTYKYIWPGDHAVDRLRVNVQEPAGASDLSTQPDLGVGGTDRDGLLYRTADFGAIAKGAQVPVAIRYSKTDPRTTTEILASNATSSGTASSRMLPGWGVLLAFAAVLVIGASAAWWWLRGRDRVPGGRSCHRCRTALRAGSRFCSACGAPAARAGANGHTR